MFPTYKDRNDLLLKLKNFEPKVVCEVGVQQGGYAKTILETIPSIEKIYLVDLWQNQENYFDLANVSDPVHQEYMANTITNTKPWQEKVILLKGFSTQMAEQIPDNSLDWVYIDARHDYKGCYEDIQAYWPKIKQGGVISGHDYMSADEVPGQDWSICYDGTKNVGAVKGAVNDFAALNNLQVLVSYKESAWHTWTLLKQ
jgi:hypothetical protein